MIAVLSKVMFDSTDELTNSSHKEMIETGVHRAEWYKKKQVPWPDAFFDKPAELKKFMESQGLKTIGMFGLEGLSTNLNKETNHLYKDKKNWDKWVELVIKHSGEPSIIGASEHFLWVGKKSER